MPGTPFIIGGTGKTGLVLARLLHADNRQVLISSRRGIAPKPFKAVAFDWNDPSTFSNPFDADSNIDVVYIIAPAVEDMLSATKPFIDLAIEKGVKKFVLLASTGTEKGGAAFGKIYGYLVERGVDYTILRPTWFTENFQTTYVTYLHTIKDNDEIFSAAGNGRIPFVSSEDVAQAAFDAIAKGQSPNTDPALVGPESLSYDDAAEIFSEVLGRKIVHRKITAEERLNRMVAFGVFEGLARTLVQLEVKASNGEEEKYVKEPNAIIGKKTLREYVEANKDLWAKN